MRRNITKYKYQCLNDAYSILNSVGMSDKLCTPRCVMVFAAFAEMKASDTKWRNVSEAYHGTHFLREFINAQFPNKAGLDTTGYAENSRETIRKDTIKPWISAGILEAKPGLATNDKGNGYRFTSHFASLIRLYGSDQWDEALSDYRAGHQDYKEYLKQAKKIEKNYEFTYAGQILPLKKTAHNKLQIHILENLMPLIAREQQPELLYFGDASDRYLVYNQARLLELGIRVLDDSAKLPDVIAYDPCNNRILFIEAYYSDGAFTVDRVKSIASLCHCDDDIEVAFITAFDSTNKMLRAYKDIAWDTDIWAADEPTHLLHKNGDKFVGRKFIDYK